LVLLAGLITSALLPTGFHEDNLGRTPTIDLSQITVSIPVEKPFEMDWLLTVAMIYTLGIFLFLIRFGLDYYSN
jgi:hypothetical protein